MNSIFPKSIFNLENVTFSSHCFFIQTQTEIAGCIFLDGIEKKAE